MIKYLIAVLMVISFIGCSDQSAGADDFPNSVSALQGDISDGINNKSKVVVPSTNDPFEIDESELEDVALESSMPQTSYRVDLSGLSTSEVGDKINNVSYADTASGYFIIETITQGVAKQNIDSLWVLWNEFSKDVIEGNEQVFRFSNFEKYNTGFIRFTIVEDADGDSIVNGGKGVGELVEITSGVKNNTSLSVSVMLIGAGEDGVIDDGGDGGLDNWVFSASQKYYLNDVLKSEKVYEDLDGDSLISNGSDSSKIRVYDYKNYLGDLAEDTTTLERVDLLTFVDESENVTLDYFRRDVALGVVKESSIVDSLGNPRPLADTIWVKEIRYSKSSPELILQEAKYKVSINEFGKDQNGLLKFIWIRRDRSDNVGFTYRLTPVEVLREGELFKEGKLFLEIEAPEANYLLKGDVIDGRLEGELTTSESDKVWGVSWLL